MGLILGIELSEEFVRLAAGAKAPSHDGRDCVDAERPPERYRLARR